ncbi:glycosyl transferase group 1 [Calothrix sp. PCC 7716]|nr:glycosyl transferase group 1 [Calothrix sp. PCC 7716]
MKILQVHNAYQHAGGEEVVVAAEYDMLKQYGHTVQQWIIQNSGLDNINFITKTKIGLQSIWSHDSYKHIRQKLQEFQPDVVHVHNTVPLISPSVYTACRDAGVPVVHTLHNYKLICPGGYLYRNGSVCEDCIGKLAPYPAVEHGCYRGSCLQTALAAAGLLTNRLGSTYKSDVDIYIALTSFARKKFIAGGLPAERIAVKPNFVSAEIQPGKHQAGYVLFVGKLVEYKGIETILQAWHQLDETIPLKIVGQGPLEILLKSNLPPNVEYLGIQPRETVLNLMKDASFVVFPSEWYEGFPMTITEAFATASPVVAARLGASAEIVKEGFSGWHFTPGDAIDLARIVQKAWSNAEELQRRGKLARKQYDNCYSQDKNYEMLINIYRTAIDWQNHRQALTVF